MSFSIALVAPSGVPFVVGGAEKLWWGLAQHVNRHTAVAMELVKLPSPERNFWEVVDSYARFAALELDHFDAVISTKYPAWMVRHRNHVVYLQHTLRGLYDTWPAGWPTGLGALPGAAAQALGRALARPGRPHEDELPELFGRLDALRRDPGLEPAARDALCAFPGPLIRAAVRRLDAIALAPGRVRRHLAISATVAGREGYFPPGATVTVLPHPSNLEGLEAPETAAMPEGAGVSGVSGVSGLVEAPAGGYVFTASRLDGPKRVDLLIRAWRQARTELPLWIAGDGPQRAAWEALAAGDGRIRFLGRLSDEALVAHYRGALFVPFVPYDEDMGLITLEAMQAGKPVLTVADAGGVREFVEDGVNGRVVACEPAALAAAVDALLADRPALAAMGAAARRTAAAVNWPRTAAGLLAAVGAVAGDAADAAGARLHGEAGGTDGPGASGFKPRLLMVGTYPVWPADGGGKQRVLKLAQGLSKGFAVTLLNLAPCGTPAQSLALGPDLRELRVPASPLFAAMEQRLSERLGAPVTDVAAMLGWPQLPQWVEAFQALSAEADVVVCAHCYAGPMVRAHWQGPLWYDGHNVELDMKAQVFRRPLAAAPFRAEPPPPPWGVGLAMHPPALQREGLADALLAWVGVEEQRLAREATGVFCVSEADRARFHALYGVPLARLHGVANGTTLPASPRLEPAGREALKAALGLEGRPLAVFLGSYHGPNLAALEAVGALVEACPAWQFVVAGSVGLAWKDRPAVDRLAVTGVLEESALHALLGAADLGLNPMRSGSGTNLKMLDCIAHGACCLSTAVGARGLGLEAGVHYLEAPVEGFAAVMNAQGASGWRAQAQAIRPRAWSRVAETLGWERLAGQMAQVLRSA